MSATDPRLKKLSVEREILTNELRNLESASTAQEASQNIVKFIETTDEPFVKPVDPNSPWLASTSSHGCCTIS